MRNTAVGAAIGAATRQSRRNALIGGYAGHIAFSGRWQT